MGKVIDFVSFALHRNKPKEHLIETSRYEILIKRDIKRLKRLAVEFKLNVNKSKLFKNNRNLKYSIIINGTRLIEDTEDLGTCLKNVGKAIFNKNEQVGHIKKLIKNNLNEISRYAIGMKVIVTKIIEDLTKISETSELIKDAEEIKENILSNLLIIPEMIKSSNFIEEQRLYEIFIKKFNDELNIFRKTTDHEEDLVKEMAA